MFKAFEFFSAMSACFISLAFWAFGFSWQGCMLLGCGIYAMLLAVNE